jgi:hypothetical protein
MAGLAVAVGTVVLVLVTEFPDKEITVVMVTHLLTVAVGEVLGLLELLLLALMLLEVMVGRVLHLALQVLKCFTLAAAVLAGIRVNAQDLAVAAAAEVAEYLAVDMAELRITMLILAWLTLVVVVEVHRKVGLVQEVQA